MSPLLWLLLGFAIAVVVVGAIRLFNQPFKGQIRSLDTSGEPALAVVILDDFKDPTAIIRIQIDTARARALNIRQTIEFHPTGQALYVKVPEHREPVPYYRVTGLRGL